MGFSAGRFLGEDDEAAAAAAAGEGLEEPRSVDPAAIVAAAVAVDAMVARSCSASLVSLDGRRTSRAIFYGALFLKDSRQKNEK